MGLENIIIQLVLIFAGAAIFATLFLYLRQPIILAYILLGIAIGPWGAGLISNADQIEKLSHVGIILLLYLLGLDLQPERLIHLFGKTTILTLVTSVVFLLLGLLVGVLFAFPFKDSLIIGAALMFSSTIVSLKLIPTTALHHKHTGEMMTSVLLLQDILAIFLILLISGGNEGTATLSFILLLVKLLLLAAVFFFIIKYVVMNLFIKFDTIQEYSFLLSLGWGLLGAGLAKLAGLSFEMGAFIAGVTFASLPVAQVITEQLKPLRDFFLILFFFSIGASFDLMATREVLLAGIVLTALLMLSKPLVYRWGFRMVGERDRLATELGVRLGQASEFSLLVAHSALKSGHIQPVTSYLIQTVVILTFVVSTYLVVYMYPTPISSKPGRHRD